MSRRIDVVQQAQEICSEIRLAVESFWIMDVNADYQAMPLRGGDRLEFADFSAALSSMSFDCLVIKVCNLLDHSNKRDVLSLKSFAQALSERRGHEKIVQSIERIRERNDALKRAIDRVRNNGVGHMSLSGSSADHLMDARLGIKEMREFLQDLICLFSLVAPICGELIAPPDRKVQHELRLMFHLAADFRRSIVSFRDLPGIHDLAPVADEIT